LSGLVADMDKIRVDILYIADTDLPLLDEDGIQLELRIKQVDVISAEEQTVADVMKNTTMEEFTMIPEYCLPHTIEYVQGLLDKTGWTPDFEKFEIIMDIMFCADGDLQRVEKAQNDLGKLFDRFIVELREVAENKQWETHRMTVKLFSSSGYFFIMGMLKGEAIPGVHFAITFQELLIASRVEEINAAEYLF
jgi:hypothetical protein